MSKKAFLQGWEEKTSRSSGDKYWVHLATGESTWERPTEKNSKDDARSKDAEYEVFDENGRGGDGGCVKPPAVFGFCTVFAPFV